MYLPEWLCGALGFLILEVVALLVASSITAYRKRGGK